MTTVVIPKLSCSNDQPIPGATIYTISLQDQRRWHWIVPSDTANSYVLGPPHEGLLGAVRAWVDPTLNVFFYSLPPPFIIAAEQTGPSTGVPAGSSLQGLRAGYWNFGVGDKDTEKELERIGTAAVVEVLGVQEAWLTSSL